VAQMHSIVLLVS